MIRNYEKKNGRAHQIYLIKIISNMPKHLQHVIKQKDYPTKY